MAPPRCIEGALKALVLLLIGALGGCGGCGAEAPGSEAAPDPSAEADPVGASDVTQGPTRAQQLSGSWSGGLPAERDGSELTVRPDTTAGFDLAICYTWNPVCYHCRFEGDADLACALSLSTSCPGLMTPAHRWLRIEGDTAIVGDRHYASGTMHSLSPSDCTTYPHPDPIRDAFRIVRAGP